MSYLTSPLTRRRFLQTATACALAPRLHAQTPAPAPAWTPLGKLAATHHIPFGFALNYNHTTGDAAYQELVAREATIAVCENAMKWEGLHAHPEGYDFTQADAIIAFTQAHNIKMRGHTFVWHRALPPWVQRETDKAAATKMLEDHITTVATRYKGKIHSWDVVNEAIYMKDNTPGNFRDDYWYKVLGPSCLDIAYRTAHAADPKAILAYNEWGLEYDNLADPKKRVAVLAMLTDLVKRGIPVQALGMQSHLRAGSGEHFGPGLPEFIKAIKGLGLEIFITEMDVSDSRLPATTDIATRDAAVADVYKRYMEIMLPHVSAVLTWGVKDVARATGAEEPAAGELKSQRPLLFDFEGKPKPAAYAVAEVFRSK